MRILILLLLSFNAFAADLLIDYDEPTTREDGTVLEPNEIDRYVLSVVGGDVIAGIPQGVTEYVVEGFTVTPPQCFELVTYDTQGLHSEPASVCLSAKPSGPSSIRIRIQ